MIEVDNVSVHIGSFVLREVSFAIPTGAYGVLMGRTGCGKTTLLESLLGLRQIESGRIRLGGRDVTELDPAERGAGFVPQEGALFARMTVRDQLGFALALRRATPDAVRRRVAELAEQLALGDLLDRESRGLSGGERQRVALGRALSHRPEILCLDEPLSSLDAETWSSLCALLKSVQRESRVTVLHVTHNPREAELLADCVLRLEAGRLLPAESPEPTAAAAKRPAHS
jgi:molybdate/tungstate transport system ATP-binding protein